MEILAFDFGGTRGRCGLGLGDGTLRHVTSLEREPGDDGQRWLSRLLETGHEVAGAAHELAAVGISFGGPVTPDGRVISMHVPGWERVDLVEAMKSTFRLPVCIENDANAGALGEHRFGAGRGCKYMVFFQVSTGIGGGVILNDELYRGAHGMAAEFGHMVLHPGPNAPSYAAGKPGVLEALGSGPAIARVARARARDLSPAEIEKLTARDVFNFASEGKTWAVAVVNETVNHLARGVAAAICAYDVERVVIGGGVSLAGDALFKPLRRAVNEYLPHFLEDKAEVVPAALGDHAPLMGAIAAASRLM